MIFGLILIADDRILPNYRSELKILKVGLNIQLTSVGWNECYKLDCCSNESSQKSVNWFKTRFLTDNEEKERERFLPLFLLGGTIFKNSSNFDHNTVFESGHHQDIITNIICDQPNKRNNHLFVV